MYYAVVSVVQGEINEDAVTKVNAEVGGKRNLVAAMAERTFAGVVIGAVGPGEHFADKAAVVCP